MFSLEEFNIEYDFPEELYEIAKNINTKASTPIRKNYKSVYDYIAIIYYFRFVEKLENSIIAEKLGIQVEGFHMKLYSLGWHYSNDYNENKKIQKEEKERLGIELQNAKAKIKEIKLNRNKKFRQVIKNIESKRVYPSTYKKYGISTLEEYLKILFYLLHIKEQPLTTIELSTMFDLSLSGMQSRLRDVGLSISHEDAIAKKKLRKVQNYESSIRNGKSTRAKSLAENFMGGSRNENYFRAILALKIYDYFSSDYFDIVVGVNTTGILKAKEIDIPLIIYSIKDNRLYRFVLEYNGEKYHKEDDEEKEALAIQRGWIYIPIFEQNNDRTSNNINILENRVNHICESIRNYVNRECFSISIRT